MFASRAPARGRYDRRQSRAARFGEQRRRLLVAAARAHLEGAATVSRVVAIAGVGRNTFYECFDDFEHALRAARGEVAKRMSVVLVAVAREEHWVEELAQAWVATVLEEPVLALAALQVATTSSVSVLGSVFEQALNRGVSRRSNALDAAARLGLELAVAAAEACARGMVRAAVERPASDGLRIESGLQPDQIVTALAASVRVSLLPVLGDKV